MSDIFGGKKSSGTQQSTSQSSNQAYPYLQGALSSNVSNGTGAGNSLAALLGVGGDPAAQQQAFQNWRNSTGYQFGLNQGTEGITTNNAAKGLLNSGGTAKAIDQFGQNYANTQYQDYLSPLQSLLGSGIQSANTIGGAGQTSSSQSTGSTSSSEKPGIGGFLGSALSMIAAPATGGASLAGLF